MGNSAFRQFIFEECMEAEDLKKLNVNQIKRKVFIPSKALYIRIFLKAVEKGIL